MAIKLHRCSVTFAKMGGHPCWRVQKALDEAGVEYELVKESPLRWKRKEYEAKTGTKLLPAIEFEDGTWLREESKDLAARIASGRLRPEQSAPAQRP
jgi:glutathione S-transferase